MSIYLLFVTTYILNALFDPNAVFFDEINDISCSKTGFSYIAHIERYTFLIDIDSSGAPIHMYRIKDECDVSTKIGEHAVCNKPPSALVKNLWDKADAVNKHITQQPDICGRHGWGYETNNPTPGIIEWPFTDGDKMSLTAKNFKVNIVTEFGKGHNNCKPLRMNAIHNGIRILLAEDTCRPGEEEKNDVIQWSAQNAISQNQDRIALSLIAERYDKNNSAIKRGRVVVIDHKKFATIDVLDSCTNASSEEVASKLSNAGFHVMHRGKAKAVRSATVIYYADGFKSDAYEMAKTIGVPMAAVNPLTWRSPYAITIAVGGNKK